MTTRTDTTPILDIVATQRSGIAATLASAEKAGTEKAFVEAAQVIAENRGRAADWLEHNKSAAPNPAVITIHSMWVEAAENVEARLAEIRGAKVRAEAEDRARIIAKAEAEADAMWKAAEKEAEANAPYADQPFARLLSQIQGWNSGPAAGVWEELKTRSFARYSALTARCEELRSEARAKALYDDMGLDTVDTPLRRYAGVFMDNCVSVVYAAKGYGKTVLTLEMLLKDVAEGRRKRSTVRLLYVAVDAIDSAKRSFAAAYKRHGLEPKDVWRACILADRDLSLLPPNDGPSSLRARVLETVARMNAVAPDRAGCLPVVVLIDTFAAALTGRDVASSAAVAATHEAGKLLSEDAYEDDFNPISAVVVLHHSRQSDDKHGAGRAEILNGTEGAYRIERKKRGHGRSLVVERDKFMVEETRLLDFAIKSTGTPEQPELQAVIHGADVEVDKDGEGDTYQPTVPEWVPVDLRDAYEALAGAEPEDGYHDEELNSVLDKLAATPGASAQPSAVRMRRGNMRRQLSEAGILRPLDTGRTVIAVEKGE